MAEVHCLYCGGKVPDDRERCPHCDAPSHFRRRDRGRRVPWIVPFGFGLMVLATIALMLWLPRSS